jgi:hypothetical protein
MTVQTPLSEQGGIVDVTEVLYIWMPIHNISKKRALKKIINKLEVGK